MCSRPQNTMYFLTSSLPQSNRTPAPGKIWGRGSVRKIASTGVTLTPVQPGLPLPSFYRHIGLGKPGSYSECSVVQCEPRVSGLGGPLLSHISLRSPIIQSPSPSPSSSSLDPLVREKRLIRRYIGSAHAPPQLHLPLEGSLSRMPLPIFCRFRDMGAPQPESSFVYQLLL